MRNKTLKRVAKDTEEYNGWTNYPTWAVHLWLTNEEGSYSYWMGVAQITREESEYSDEYGVKRQARGVLADMLKEQITENMPVDGGDMSSDLLQYALDQVNWHEIADAFLEQ